MTEFKDLIRQSLPDLVAELEARGITVRGKSCRCPRHETSADSTPSADIRQDRESGAWRVYCYAPSCGFKGDIFDVRALGGGPAVGDQLRDLKREQTPPASRPENRTETRAGGPAATPTGEGVRLPGGRPAPASLTPPPAQPAPTAEPASRNLRVYATLADLEAAVPDREITYTRGYEHPDTGAVEMVVIRHRVRGKDGTWRKSFKQAHPVPGGGFVMVAPEKPWPIYNRRYVKGLGLDWVIVVEGEKCCNALSALKIPAVTSPGGAKNARNADWSFLRGLKVYLWPDNDADGRSYVRDVAAVLDGVAGEILTIEPDDAGLSGDGDDVANFLAANATLTDAQKRDAVLSVLDSARRVTAARDFHDRMHDCRTGKYSAVPWPFATLSRLTQSLLPGTVTIVCGEAGDGKSYFVMEAAIHWHREKVPVAVYMLEEDRAYWLQRVCAVVSGVPELTRPDWINAHPTESARLESAAAAFLDGFARRLTDAPNEPPTYGALLEWLERQAKAGTRVAIIDPITGAAASEAPWIADQSFMVRAKVIAREHGMSLVLVTHPRLSKKGANPLDNLAGGAAFPRFAQTVLWLKKEVPVRDVTYHSTAGPIRGRCNRTLHVGKARNGPGGGLDIAYDLAGESLRFAEKGLILDDDTPAAALPPRPPLNPEDI